VDTGLEILILPLTTCDVDTHTPKAMAKHITITPIRRHIANLRSAVISTLY
jgi:hypothetical protein